MHILSTNIDNSPQKKAATLSDLTV